MTDLSPEARELLEKARDAERLDGDRRERLRAAVMAAVAPAGAGPGGDGGAASAAGAGKLGLAGKIALAVAIAGGAAGGWVYLASGEAPDAAERIEAASVLPAPDATPPDAAPTADAAFAPADAAIAADAVPARAPAPEPRGERPASAQEPPAAPDIAAELALLERARIALRAGDTAAALAALGTHAAVFDAGQLSQEREVLRVEALCRAGRGADARAAAEDFARQWPDSVHLEAVKTPCSER